MGKSPIVIDTNVLISSLRSKRGTSYALINQLEALSIEIAVSVPLVIEYEKVAFEQQDSIHFSIEEIQEYIDYICSIAIHQKIHFLWRPYLRDTKDDMVIELAVAANCRYIVTFNKKDFSGIDKFGIFAVTPKEFLHIFGE
ncbi:MAG: putative toxin-antitoxin system toxin component, PIN family [Spirochaetota bacterium]|nr:putative toxin-antitoxin system toxin component, PIN family [Spirochaetota bacterium]